MSQSKQSPEDQCRNLVAEQVESFRSRATFPLLIPASSGGCSGTGGCGGGWDDDGGGGDPSGI